MKPKRKGIGNSKRFKVFERDGYQCRYCGMRPPEVVLHVDHFIPVIKGGGNEMDNLLTSCSQCNQGKKARLSRPPNEELEYENIIVDKKEVLKQLKAIKLLDEKIQYEKDMAWSNVCDYWGILHDGEPELNIRAYISLRTFLKHFSTGEIKEAMDLAYSQCKGNHISEFKYMCGILQNWKKGITNKPENKYE